MFDETKPFSISRSRKEKIKKEGGMIIWEKQRPEMPTRSATIRQSKKTVILKSLIMLKWKQKSCVKKSGINGIGDVLFYRLNNFNINKIMNIHTISTIILWIFFGKAPVGMDWCFLVL